MVLYYLEPSFTSSPKLLPTSTIAPFGYRKYCKAEECIGEDKDTIPTQSIFDPAARAL